jgi:hypothetical protein
MIGLAQRDDVPDREAEEFVKSYMTQGGESRDRVSQATGSRRRTEA